MADRFREVINQMWCSQMTQVSWLVFLLLSNESSFTFICLVGVNLPLPLTFSQGYEEEEETEAFDVSLTKNTQGLGITIAGYVGDKNSGEKWQITFWQ